MDKTVGSILVVDDSEDILITVDALLSRHFTTIITESDPRKIPIILKKNSFDAILLDMNYSAGIHSGKEGIFWLEQVLMIDPDASVIMMTAYADYELAVTSIKKGAVDFIEKPWNDQKFVLTLQNAIELRRSRKEIDRLTKAHKNLVYALNQDYDIVQGVSPLMRKVQDTIDKIADVDANVLILGENGTGKGLIAKEIHRKSLRINEPFITVDMGAIHESLFESELFGHVKGAFTDAKSDKAGRFEIANGGTLFLDEIGNLSLPLQAKLLSAIQSRTITRVGSTVPIKVDIRLICATNRPVYSMVSDLTFREDLLFRINTIQITLPPLRERKEDLPILIQHFFGKFKLKYRKPNLEMHPSTLKKLSEMDWPGNIRQLQNTLESSIILCSGKTLTNLDLLYQAIPDRPAPVSRSSATIEENEKDLIFNELERSSWNISRAAENLGIARSTLYQKMKRYDI
jgi:two-component system, NtrC family, response regulator HydG